MSERPNHSATDLDVSIVIPVYNEAAILETAVTDLRDNLAGMEPPVRFEIILAENGSRDRTVALATALSDRFAQRL